MDSNTQPNTTRTRRRVHQPEPQDDLAGRLSERIIGQSLAIQAIAPYVEMYQAGLAPEGRPAGVFLLLGPTGTGKTRTVEALADVLHGHEKHFMKIDCGEFQMEHEVAKLLGAPPGYLGHRETTPMLTQQKVNNMSTDRCGLTIVLFDEIEKAAPSLTRLLLGVLDKAILRLGDNTVVNFERTLIFLTSNLGAREMNREIKPDFGFGAMVSTDERSIGRKLESIAIGAARRKFSPEFMNRVDVICTYHPLSTDSLASILDQQIRDLQHHILSRLGSKGFLIEITPESREYLLRKGTSAEYGARELKRVIHRKLTQPLAAMVARNRIQPGATVRVHFDTSKDTLLLKAA